MKRRETPRDRATLILRLIAFLVVALSLGQVVGRFSAPSRLIDFYAIITLVLVWTLPMRWAVWGIPPVALWVAAFGLDSLAMSSMGIGLTAFFAYRSARLLDMEFWVLQPFVAIFILAAVEIVLRFAYLLYYGAAAPAPVLSLLFTAALTPVGWLLGRQILLQRW